MTASDVHVGYKEKDPERGRDSFVALKEIFEIAQERNVDFLLLGGDLFHENKPSRKTLHSTMEIFQKYCLGDRPCEVEVISDQAVNFGHTSRSITGVNYENPNINISMPVFSIHGNHDDPTGASELSAIDILSVAGVLNHFGKHTSLESIEISPVLLQKGTTKIALYGLGSIRDERLHRLFLNRKVSFLRPEEDIDDWLNMFVLHQNRVKHGQTNYIPEQFIDEFIDLVIWGHEHECLIDPQETAKNFLIMQPGSPVATSLCEAESKQKHVAILKVKGREMKFEKIPLRTVRQMFVETVVLSKHVNKSLSAEENEKQARIYCEKRVEHWLSEAEKRKSGHPDQPSKPLIRIRVDYSGGFEPFSAHRFGAQFAKRVGNPENIVHFLKKSARKENSDVDVRDIDAMIGTEEVEKVKMEDLVREYLNAKDKKDQMSLLTAQEISEAVACFVDKQDKDAIYEECERQIQTTKLHLLQMKDDLTLERHSISNLVNDFHDEREKELQSQLSSNPTEVREALQKARQKYARSRASSELPDQSIEVDSDKTTRGKSTRGRGRGSRGRGSRGRKGANQSGSITSDIRSFSRPSQQSSRSIIDLTLDRDKSTGMSRSSARRKPNKGVSFCEDSDEENPFDLDD